MMQLDNFALGTYRSCPMKYHWRIERALVKAGYKVIAPEFGSGIHRALEVYYGGDKNNDPPTFKARTSEARMLAIAAFEHYFGPYETDADDKHTVAKGVWLVERYFEHYPNDPMEVIDTEVGAAMEIGGGGGTAILYTARIDLIAEWQSPKGVYGFDHKTTTGPMDKLVAKPNNQFTGYIATLMELYEGVLGFMVNIIGVYKGEKYVKGPKKGLDKEVFMRVPTSRTPAEIKEWKADIIQTVQGIESCMEKGRWPHYDNCNSFNSLCPYIDLCNCPSKDVQERLIEGGVYVVEPWTAFGDEDKQVAEGGLGAS